MQLAYLLVSLIEGMYSKTLTVVQWLSRRKMPRKPEEGGVGRRGQAVTDWSQSHSDHSDSETTNLSISVLDFITKEFSSFPTYGISYLPFYIHAFTM